MPAGQELARGESRAIFDRAVVRALRPMALGLCLFMGVNIIAGFLPVSRQGFWPTGIWAMLLAIDVISMLAFAVIAWVASRRPVQAHWAHPIMAGLGLLLLANTLTAYFLTGDLFYLIYLPFMIIGHGAILLSPLWLTLCVGTIFVAALIAAQMTLAPGLLGHYAPAMIGAAILAVVMMIARRRATLEGHLALLAMQAEMEERQQLEAQLAQSQRLDTVGKLVSGVAHDFNNLLMVVIGYADTLLQDEDYSESQRNGLYEIRKAGESAAELASKLLVFSRQQVLQPQVRNINELIEGAEGLLRRSITEQVDLQLVLDPAAGSVNVDPVQFEQVLINLAINARDAMADAGGLLRISTNVLPRGIDSDGWVELTVSDTGVGMSASVRDRAFEPFFTTKPADQGTGLGLAMVYGVVTQSGGYIDLSTRSGAGSTFTIRLPQVRAASGTAVARPNPPSNLLKGKQILLVDDNAAVRATVEAALLQTGCSVLTADGASNALRVVATQRPDLLLTDVAMPHTSGIELHAELARRGMSLPVVFMSGYAADSGNAVLQANPFISKPFRADELVALLTHTFARHEPAESQQHTAELARAD